MIVYGNIATALEQRNSRDNKTYYTFRLAENQGRDEHRTTTWYDCVAFISELDADMLNKGMLVKVTGTLKGEPYKKRDSEELGVSLRITSGSVVPYQPRRTGENAGSGDAGAGA